MNHAQNPDSISTMRGIVENRVSLRDGIAMLVGMSSAEQAVRWYRRLRIKGPIAGRLYVCYRHDLPGKTATAMTPEGAYSAWQSYWGAQL